MTTHKTVMTFENAQHICDLYTHGIEFFMMPSFDDINIEQKEKELLRQAAAVRFGSHRVEEGLKIWRQELETNKRDDKLY